MKKELEMYPTKFNRYFNEDGWIVHDTLDFEVIKRAVNLYENNEKEEAINLIKNFYSPENIEKRRKIKGQAKYLKRNLNVI